MRRIFVLCVLATLLFEFVACDDSDELVIHIIPHSHTDPGWLISYQDYYAYYVRNLLNKTLDNLFRNPKHTFVFAEISFFRRWWQEQSPSTQSAFHDLVERGRFEFLGGGWVMNDEGLVTAEAVVNQMTEGHAFLASTFRLTPTVAWQIDPFGHSAATPMLYSQMGIENLIINRIDYREKERRRWARELEFIWQPSSAWPGTEMFTHVLHDHYSAPGFDFERDPANEVPLKETFQVFLRNIRRTAKMFRTKHVMIPWGDDFRFQNAETQFTHMDQMMAAINGHNFGMEVIYSTPSRYFAAVKAAVKSDSIAMPTYAGDFFPYADKRDDFWTGYFTSRPEVKSAIRSLDAAARCAELSLAFAAATKRFDRGQESEIFRAMASVRQAAGLMQHHDTITGTSSDPATADSLRILREAEATAADILRRTLQMVMVKPPRSLPVARLNASAAVGEPVELAADAMGVRRPQMIAVFNSLGWQRSFLVRLRVPTGHEWRVTYPPTRPLSGQVAKVVETANPREYELQFYATPPPLGYQLFVLWPVEGAGDSSQLSRTVSVTNPAETGSSFIENDVLRIDFDGFGDVVSVSDKETKAVYPLKIQPLEYHVSYGGAYIMRTKPSNIFELIKSNLYANYFKARPHPLSTDPAAVKTEVRKGPHYEEIRRQHPRFRQVLRLYKSPEPGRQRAIEHTLTIEPPPLNREVFVRFETNIRNGRTFFVDNGLEAVRRRYDPHQPVHANVYPTPSAAFINDSAAEFLMLSRQAVGVVSPDPGVLDVFLHRRLSTNDLRGLSCCLNESSVAHHVQWLVLGQPTCVEQLRRPLDLRLSNPVRVLDGVVESEPDLIMASVHLSLLRESLPLDKHVMTFALRDIDKMEFALRIQQLLDHNSLYATPASLPVSDIWGAIAFDEGRSVGLSLQGSPGPSSAKPSMDFAPAGIQSMVATFKQKPEFEDPWFQRSPKDFTWRRMSERADSDLFAAQFVDEHVHSSLSWFGLLLLVLPFVGVAAFVRRSAVKLRRVAAGDHKSV